MKKPIKTTIITTTMGVMLACAYLLGTAQAEPLRIQAIKAVKAIADGKHIAMDAATFQDSYEHHIDMQQVTGFEVSVNGLQIYFADGTGYYWER